MNFRHTDAGAGGGKPHLERRWLLWLYVLLAATAGTKVPSYSSQATWTDFKLPITTCHSSPVDDCKVIKKLVHLCNTLPIFQAADATRVLRLFQAQQTSQALEQMADLMQAVVDLFNNPLLKASLMIRSKPVAQPYDQAVAKLLVQQFNLDPSKTLREVSKFWLAA